MAFGRLKGRWRMLLKRSDIDYRFMPNVVGACCTLHNMIEKRKESFPQHWEHVVHDNREYPQPNAEHPRSRDSYAGTQIRDALCYFINNN